VHGGTGTSTSGVWGKGRGVFCEWMVGWGRVSDNDGHGSRVSSISLLQTIHVFMMSSISIFHSFMPPMFSVQLLFLP